MEPLLPEKKAMWRREMEWLLCLSDHIVELMPTWQTFPDGTKLEVTSSLPQVQLTGLLHTQIINFRSSSVNNKAGGIFLMPLFDNKNEKRISCIIYMSTTDMD
jgi:hypothetical protein